MRIDEFGHRLGNARRGFQVGQPGQGLPYSGRNDRLRARLPELAFTALDPAILRLVAHYRSQLLDPERFKVDP